MSLSQRQMEGDLCTAEAPWEKWDASSPCNPLPEWKDRAGTLLFPNASCETWNSPPAWPMSRELLAEWEPPWGHCWAVSEIGVCVPDPGLVQVTSGSLFWCPCWGFFVFFCSSYCST